MKTAVLLALVAAMGTCYALPDVPVNTKLHAILLKGILPKARNDADEHVS